MVARAEGAKVSSDTGMVPEGKISLLRDLPYLGAFGVLFKGFRWPGVGRGGLVSAGETDYKTKII